MKSERKQEKHRSGQKLFLILKGKTHSANQSPFSTRLVLGSILE